MRILRSGISKRQLRVLRAVAECLFSDGTVAVPEGRLDWLMADLDDYLRATAGTTRLVLRLSTWLLQFSPWLALRRPRRLTSLPVERRLLCLQRLATSRVALVALLFGVAKIVLAMLYFEHPEALAETGYDGDCLRGANPSAGLNQKPAAPAEARRSGAMG